MSQTRGRAFEARIIWHARIYKHVYVGTNTLNNILLLSPSLQSIPQDCLQKCFTDSLPHSCLESHCFSRWRIFARVVFIVPFFSDSWLSSVVKVSSSHLHSTASFIVCRNVCVCLLLLSVCELNCLAAFLK